MSTEERTARRPAPAWKNGPGADDILLSAETCRQELEPLAERDWSVPAGDLEWSCRETLIHMGRALTSYMQHLATRATERLPSATVPDTTSTIQELLAIVWARAAVLRELAVAAPEGVRAFHSLGMADPQGFIAMGCDEILVHTHDIVQGLGGEISPPPEVCRGVLERLFPWAPTEARESPWQGLLWANGRSALPDHPRLENTWAWHSPPIAEWDGSLPRQTIFVVRRLHGTNKTTRATFDILEDARPHLFQ